MAARYFGKNSSLAFLSATHATGKHITPSTITTEANASSPAMLANCPPNHNHRHASYRGKNYAAQITKVST